MNTPIIYRQMSELKEKVAEIESKLENVYQLDTPEYNTLLDELFLINSRLAICENVLSSVK